VEIIATGSPAVAKLPSFDTELAADRIEFHAIAGIIRAHGNKGIRVRRGGITARLARLVYQFDPKTSLIDKGLDLIRDFSRPITPLGYTFVKEDLPAAGPLQSPPQ
jgi:hypothetical protein